MRTLRLLSALSLALAATHVVGTRPLAAQNAGALHCAISIETQDGQPRCTLSAEGVPVNHVLLEIGKRTGLAIEGLDPARRTALVSAELHDRPLEEVLEVVLGSVGLAAELRPGALRVVGDELALQTQERLEERALLAYARACILSPAHELGANARMRQAEIERARGNPGAALAHYDELLQRFRLSPLAHEALLQSAIACQELGQWAQASLRLRQLAQAEPAGRMNEEARVRLADCSIELGDPQRAALLIESLSAEVEPSDERAAAMRLLVLARARAAARNYEAALNCLALLRPAELDAAGRSRWCHALAVALEGAGHTAEAGRAWLMYSRELHGSAQTIALENAARLALASGDDLGAVFAAEEITPALRSAALEESARIARERLGLIEGEEPVVGSSTIDRQLQMVAGWLSTGRHAQAADVLAALEATQPLDEPQRARCAVYAARAAAHTHGLEHALALLRTRRPQMLVLASRVELDLTAAELLEAAGRYEEAALAYEGRY
jgi:hypothetical protein